MVTDFGIAKAVTAAADENLTQTGSAVGTPAYMSPEQAAGESELDGRSDVYSLGCMVFEMLAGTAPFTGPTAQAIIAKRFTEAAPSLRAAAIRPYPRWWTIAVTRSLAPDPRRSLRHRGPVRPCAHDASGSTPPANVATTAVPQAVGAAKSIAVLPFVNMSNDPENEYFTDGIAEEIINALSKIQALRVASRTSSFAFKGKNEDIGEHRPQAQGGHGPRGKRPEGGEQAAGHGPAGQRGRRISSLVRTLRPRAGGRLRDSGRNRRQHREGAAGRAERRGKDGRSRRPPPPTSRPTSTTCAAASSSTSSAAPASSSPAGCSSGPWRSIPG